MEGRNSIDNSMFVRPSVNDDHLRRSFEHALIHEVVRVSTDIFMPVGHGDVPPLPTDSPSKEIQETPKKNSDKKYKINTR